MESRRLFIEIGVLSAHGQFDLAAALLGHITHHAREKTAETVCSTGTMRIFITERCRSFNTLAWKAMASGEAVCAKPSLGKRRLNSLSPCCNMDLPMINSPTRFEDVINALGIYPQHSVCGMGMSIRSCRIFLLAGE